MKQPKVLVRRLGISKGSFYWHFKNLDDLITTVLVAWKTQALDQVISRLDEELTPTVRLASLIQVAWANRRHLKAEAAILSAGLSGDKRIARVVKDVTRRRMDYLTTIYRDLGQSAEAAERWALTAYSAYVGTLQLVALEPRTLGNEAAIRAHALHLVTALTPRT